MNNSIIVSEQDNILVVDSRLIAAELGIPHKTFVRTIRRHQAVLEASLGHARLEDADVKMPNGATRREFSHYWLTEDQSTLLMTFSRNTPQVIACKVNLVKAFSFAKQDRFAPEQKLLNIFNLEKETLGKLSLLNFAKLFPDSPTLEGINLAEIVSDLNLIHPELANIPGQALMHVFSLFAIANKISSRKYFFTVQGREFGVRNTRYNYEVMASRSEEALSAQQFQAQIEREARHQGDRTQLAAAPTQKQLG